MKKVRRQKVKELNFGILNRILLSLPVIDDKRVNEGDTDTKSPCCDTEHRITPSPTPGKCHVKKYTGKIMVIKFCLLLHGAFAKLRKGTISFVMCLSARNSSPTRGIFMKFYIGVFFVNLLRKFRFYQILIRIMGTLHEDQCTFITALYIYSPTRYTTWLH